MLVPSLGVGVVEVVVAGEVVGAEFGDDRAADVVEGSGHAVELGGVEVAEHRLQAVVLDRLGLLEGLDAASVRSGRERRAGRPARGRARRALAPPSGR